MTRKLTLLGLCAVATVALGGCGQAVQSTPTPTPTVAPTATPSPSSIPSTPTIVLSVDHGPVGTVVHVDSWHCGNPGDPSVAISFEGPDGGDAADSVQGNADANGYLAGTLTIPATLEATHTGPGGAVAPGGYVFISHPPYCSADFTVTS